MGRRRAAVGWVGCFPTRWGAVLGRRSGPPLLTLSSMRPRNGPTGRWDLLCPARSGWLWTFQTREPGNHSPSLKLDWPVLRLIGTRHRLPSPSESNFKLSCRESQPESQVCWIRLVQRAGRPSCDSLARDIGCRVHPSPSCPAGRRTRFGMTIMITIHIRPVQWPLLDLTL